MRDVANSDKEWKIILLRYFNPVGAHPSGKIGENPTGIPNNLMPYVQKVALKQLPVLNVFGDDYNTRDGTAIRWVSAPSTSSTTTTAAPRAVMTHCILTRPQPKSHSPVPRSDYIHVMDLADAHVAALNRLASAPADYGCRAINVGTGRGSTVLEMVEAFRRVTGAEVATKMAPRRPGDSEAVWAATGEETWGVGEVVWAATGEQVGGTGSGGVGGDR